MALTKIGTDGVKDDAITSGKIPANAVGSSELADNAVDTDAIQNGAVTSAKIATNAVSSGQINDNAVGSNQITSDAVVTSKIAAGSITTNRIADQAVTLDKLPHGTSSNNGKFLRANNGADPSFESIPAGTTINNNADNRVITGGSGTTLNAESNVNIDSSGRLLVGDTSSDDSTSMIQTKRANNSTIRIASSDATATNFAAIDFAPANSTQGGAIICVADGTFNGSSNQSAHLRFITRNSGTDAEKVRIQADGKVGIGRTDPVNFVDIHRGADEDNILIVRGQDTSGEYCALGVNGNNAIVTAGGVSGNNTNLVFRSAPNGNETERMRIQADGDVVIGDTDADAKLHVHSPAHYVTSSSGVAHKHIHCSAVNGNAGEYGGAISFGMGSTGAAAIAARQATSDGDVVGLSFFTHDSGDGSANAVEKVRIHDGGTTSFNNGICLGNGLTYNADNVLDDYEEGTWTLTQGNFTTFNMSSSQNVGKYVKVGGLVTCWFEQNGGSLAWSTPQWVGGLPFSVQQAGAGSFTNNYPNAGGEILVYYSERLYFAQSDGYNTGNYRAVFTFTYKTTS